MESATASVPVWSILRPGQISSPQVDLVNPSTSEKDNLPMLANTAAGGETSRETLSDEHFLACCTGRTLMAY
jgi:hypothetical protein